MKIYTKTGDKGETGLFGGERVKKNSLRIESYGTVDELNAFLGLALTEVNDTEVRNLLLNIQSKLFQLGSDLATPITDKNQKLNIKRISAEDISDIEAAIDHFEEKLEPLRNFILPGGSKSAVLLHVCRTIVRRAERQVVALSESVNIGDFIVIFLNRLSDLLFVLSRFENKVSNIEDTKWNP